MSRDNTYSPGGRGHRVLSALAAGKTVYPDLEQAGVGEKNTAREIGRVIRAMREDRLIGSSPAGYRLTDRGREALAILNDGLAFRPAAPTEQPNARVFRRSA